jgi:hypothetical protein
MIERAALMLLGVVLGALGVIVLRVRSRRSRPPSSGKAGLGEKPRGSAPAPKPSADWDPLTPRRPPNFRGQCHTQACIDNPDGGFTVGCERCNELRRERASSR